MATLRSKPTKSAAIRGMSVDMSETPIAQAKGSSRMGVERSSFLVGADGKVAKVWRKGKPEEHAAAVLAAAKALG